MTSSITPIRRVAHSFVSRTLAVQPGDRIGDEGHEGHHVAEIIRHLGGASAVHIRCSCGHWFGGAVSPCPHRSVYVCSGCNLKHCMDCDAPSEREEYKTAVRWCPRCRAEGKSPHEPVVTPPG